MTCLTVGTAALEFETEGDPTKPALLLSHALGTSLSMWDAQVPELTKHFRVIRYDLRGHGGSSQGGSPASIAKLGGDALALLDALEVDKAHVLGLSMGGAIAIWLLVNAPRRIGRAVLANTAPRLGSPDAWNRRITSVLAGGIPKNAVETIERWFSADFATREPERVRAIYDMLCKTSPRGYADACAAIRDMALQAAVGNIHGDVLVISGRDDPTVPEKDAKALAASIAGARHVALAARHLSNIEAQNEFNAAVIAFLTRPKAVSTKTRKPKATSPASSPTTRGGAGRRSNAARSPLKKMPVERGTGKKTQGRAAAKKAEAHKRPTKQRSSTRRPAPKKASKRSAKKASAGKVMAARRTTSVAKSRGPVAKPKATKKTVKGAGKKSVPKAMKKLPTTRRKPAGQARRPSGRRKT